MADLGRIVRGSGLLDVLRPADELRHSLAVQTVVDRSGRITEEAARSVRTPMRMDWTPGETGRKPAQAPGRAVLLRAYAETAPTSGNCTVTVTMVTALAGEATLGTVQITQGYQFGEAVIAEDVPAGAWLGREVTVASGASGVSVSCTVEVR
jgi:hypothetical protein